MSSIEKRLKELEKQMDEIREIKVMVKDITRLLLRDRRRGFDRYEYGRGEYNSDVEELQEEKRELEEKNKKLQRLLYSKNRELDIFRLKLEKQLSLSRLKELYETLSYETKGGLKNIFRGDDELELFASGILNFDAIWEYAKDLNNQHKDRDFRRLKEITEIIFNAIKDIKKYSLLDIKVGDSFDMDLMVRDNRSSSQSGKVKYIVLFGYKRKSRVVQKAIVEIE